MKYVIIIGFLGLLVLVLLFVAWFLSMTPNRVAPEYENFNGNANEQSSPQSWGMPADSAGWFGIMGGDLEFEFKTLDDLPDYAIVKVRGKKLDGVSREDFMNIYFEQVLAELDSEFGPAFRSLALFRYNNSLAGSIFMRNEGNEVDRTSSRFLPFQPKYIIILYERQDWVEIDPGNLYDS